MQPSTGYTLGFAAAICVFCSIFVAGSAVALKDKQEVNKVLDRQKKVLSVAGVFCVDDMGPEEITKAFESAIPVLVDMAGEPVPVPVKVADAEGIDDVNAYDPRKAAKAEGSLPQEDNPAKVASMARYQVVYKVETGPNPCPGATEEQKLAPQLIVPIQGPGLWSTLHGYVSLTDTDYNTVNGLIFYEHAETPGLGGEVDNPKWKAKWPGKELRKDPLGTKVDLSVVKGAARDEFGVDGLSGATITSNGVSHALRFWLGDSGFTPDVLMAVGDFDPMEVAP